MKSQNLEFNKWTLTIENSLLFKSKALKEHWYIVILNILILFIILIVQEIENQNIILGDSNIITVNMTYSII